jgi:hypothetical protein
MVRSQKLWRNILYLTHKAFGDLDHIEILLRLLISLMQRGHYFWLALASATAAKKQITVTGVLNPKMTLVVSVPKSGLPEVSSKIEPTAAIAATHEPSNSAPLFGVRITSPSLKIKKPPAFYYR